MLCEYVISSQRPHTPPSHSPQQKMLLQTFCRLTKYLHIVNCLQPKFCANSCCIHEITVAFVLASLEHFSLPWELKIRPSKLPKSKNKNDLQLPLSGMQVPLGTSLVHDGRENCPGNIKPLVLLSVNFAGFAQPLFTSRRHTLHRAIVTPKKILLSKIFYTLLVQPVNSELANFGINSCCSHEAMATYVFIDLEPLSPLFYYKIAL